MHISQRSLAARLLSLYRTARLAYCVRVFLLERAPHNKEVAVASSASDALKRDEIIFRSGMSDQAATKDSSRSDGTNQSVARVVPKRIQVDNSLRREWLTAP